MSAMRRLRVNTPGSGLVRIQTLNRLRNMEHNDLVVAALASAFVFAAYFLGVIHGVKASGNLRTFTTSITQSLSSTGFVWATALPICWLLLFYIFVIHVRLSRTMATIRRAAAGMVIRSV